MSRQYANRNFAKNVFIWFNTHIMSKIVFPSAYPFTNKPSNNPLFSIQIWSTDSQPKPIPVGWSPAWYTKLSITHSFWGTDSRFCMIVYIDLPQFFFKTEIVATKQNGLQNTKLIITQSIFRLGYLNFVWYFNYINLLLKIFKNKMSTKNQLAAKTQNWS